MYNDKLYYNLPQKSLSCYVASMADQWAHVFYNVYLISHKDIKLFKNLLFLDINLNIVIRKLKMHAAHTLLF